jgi:hypothetical protein
MLEEDSRDPCRRWGWACALTLLLSFSQDAEAKRTDVPGYLFSQRTDNGGWDEKPRVSSTGLMAWVGTYNLAEAQSPNTDREIFLWNGSSVEQVTDDDVDDRRPVVNNLGDVAWQRFGSDDQAEIFVRFGTNVIQVTADTVPAADRYPDINDNRWVVWGRRLAGSWYLSAFDALGGPFTVLRRGYRPHISALDHIVVSEGIVDTAGSLVQALPSPASLGYFAFRRFEINDLDQVAIEAQGGTSYMPDAEGPRDILFWDGAEMQVIYSSPGPWVGRADLNAGGVIAFEGNGGLPGSLSGSGDREIFVFDPAIGTVIQLTDDDWTDTWPTVMGDGTVIWGGDGGYAGSTSGEGDREIFVATPTGDADADGVPNQADNCPLEPNPLQEDTGGLGLEAPDGVGNACQCGDLDDNGQVSAGDVTLLRQYLAGLVTALMVPEKCGVVPGPPGCTVLDWVFMRRALTDLGPRLAQACPATLPWL